MKFTCKKTLKISKG